MNKKQKQKRKQKPNWYYIHTIDNAPAEYIKGQQICYANYKNGVLEVSRMASSLKQIRQEQKLSAFWRAKRFNRILGSDDLVDLYGYMRVAINPTGV